MNFRLYVYKETLKHFFYKNNMFIYAPYFSWERLAELLTALDALYLVTCSSGKIKRPNAEDKEDDYRYRMMPRKL